MGRHVLNTWAKQYAAGNEVMRRAVVRFASDLRARLSGPDPSALKQLLAERVVLAWLYLSWAQFQDAAAVGKVTWEEVGHHGRRVDMAHRRLMAACRTLVKVRRADLPGVLALVNVAPPGSSG